MYVKRVVPPDIIFYFAWRTLLFSTLWSGAVYAVYKYWWSGISIPFLPVATVGTAVAFYVGFKNNSSYDRLWEGRKIWGELTNLSRGACAYLLSVAKSGNRSNKPSEFVHRQIGFVNVLRLQLRKRNVWDESHLYTQMAINCQCIPSKGFELDVEDVLMRFCQGDDLTALKSARNIAKELLFRQMKTLTEMKESGVIDAYEHSDLMRMTNDLLAQQGKAERIKSFPFPRQYAYFSEVFTSIFMCLLPFGLIGEFAKIPGDFTWLTIPFSILISWIFDTMEKVGDTSENPFENGINDVPMTSICRTIEIDLKELLGESDLPQPFAPIENILM